MSDTQQEFSRIFQHSCFLLNLGAQDQETGCLYVSHLIGEDSPQCGTFATPCRTLPQALLLVNDGGKICLNGTNSESNPYECLKTHGPNGTEFKAIEKDVSIQGVSSPAHISCGLIFASRFKYGFVRKGSFSNLVFNNSRYGLFFFNVPSYDVVISKCKFINCQKAVFMLWEGNFSRIRERSFLKVTDSKFLNTSCGIEFGPKLRNSFVEVFLSNLVFDNGTYGLVLANVSSYYIAITKSKFFNFRKAAVGILWNEINSVIPEKCSLVATDSEFRYNEKSILAMLPNAIVETNISRCLFEGAKGRFNVTSDHRNVTGAVFVRSQASVVIPYPIHVLVSITESIFQELGHEDNSFAVSVRVDNLFGNGSISLSNTSFLNNENSVFVHGGLGLNFTNVTVNSTYGYAIMASAPPKTLIKAPGVRVFLENCILANNRIGIRMSTTTCLHNTARYCSTGDQTLIVRNSLILGGNETLGAGDAIRFGMSLPKRNDTRAVLKPSTEEVYLSPDFEAKLLLENVTFLGLHDCALSVTIEKNVIGLISVKNCRFLNNTQFVNRLDERAAIQIEFPNDDPPKCPGAAKGNESKKLMWDKKSELPVMIEDSSFENNVGIAGALNFLNGNITIKNCAFKNNEGVALGGHVYIKTGFGILNINNCSFLQNLIGHSRVSAVASFLRSESAGPLKIQNSSFVAVVNQEFDPIFAATKSSTIEIDSSTSFKCPDGKQITLKNNTQEDGFELVKGRETCWISVAYVKFFCEECPDGFYNLKRGSSNGLDIQKATKCLRCPYGATCENGDIEAQENFWGCYSSIPLVLVLFWGSVLLSKDKLSAKEFLTSCAFPLPFLFIWLYRFFFKKQSLHDFELFRKNTRDAEEIKKVLHDPFRPPCGDDYGTLYWESVLTGRRFLLLTIRNFITDPLTRLICLDFACVVTLVHHLISRPFRDRKANICETLSLMSLVAICTFNLAEVTLIAQGLEPAGPEQNLFYALEWIEVALLGFLPAIACILVALAAFSQVTRVLYHGIRLLRRTVCLRSQF
ncbi:hypothetical protein AWC38_SpisGene4558 [Stylophora pistillata]|uniref:Right handed beta helix domain-containing protein n=1 Tax=Stylophora pistillata TaxID=50429 RepID=A0A2B4SPS8_STYPI|nr:hypothetical protein AWC38_SpisGene4558 [Stylophora pistillata]